MDYFTIKQNKIPKLGFGTWKLQNQIAVKAVAWALEIGYRHIDTASIYNNEAEVGLALNQSQIPRSQLFITAKIWREDLSFDAMLRQAEQSLKKLKLSYVDLLLIHWPNSQYPLKKSLKALEHLQSQKATRLIGVSNFPSSLLLEALNFCPKLCCHQIEYHPFLEQKNMLALLEKNNMFLQAYSPLASGEILKSQQIEHIAKKYNKSLTQVTLRWLIEQKGVIPIVRSSQKQHIKDNFNIFDFQLEKQDQNKFYRLSHQKRRIIKPPFAPHWD